MNTETSLFILAELLAKSAALLLAVAVIGSACRRASAARRHLVWLAAFATLLLLPLTKAVAPLWAISLTPEAAPATDLLLLHFAPQSAAAWPATPAAATAPAPRWRAPDWRVTALGVWAAGVAMVLAYRLLGSAQLARLRRHSMRLEDEAGCRLASEVAREFGIRRAVDVRISAACQVPLTWGVRRPVVVLPADCCEWPEARLAAALRHELAHVARLDCLTRRLAQLACAFYWPNPFVWLAARSLRAAQEQACDDLVLRAGAGASDYAEQLFRAARALAAGGAAPRDAVAMASPSTLRRRVVAILDGGVDRRPAGRGATLAATALVACLLALSTAAQLRAAAETAPGTAQPAPAGASPRFGAHVEIEAKFIEMSAETERALDLPSDAVSVWEKGDVLKVIAALNQTSGVDLLSAPRVTTRSGQRAVIEIIHEFKYPTTWEKGAAAGLFVGKAYETMNLGVTLEVEPMVNAGDAVSLALTPQVVELLGTVDLADGKGTAASAPAGARPDQILKAKIEADVRKPFRPVFSVRKVRRDVTLKPGQTVVLGRLPQTEKVAPFESSAPKRPLWVFVTATLVSPGWVEKSRAGQSAERLPELMTRKFHLTIAALRKLGFERTTAREVLERERILLPEGGSAICNVPRGQLIVRATPEALDQIEALLARHNTGPFPDEAAPLGGDPVTEAVQSKAQKIIIPRMEFRQATLREAVEFLKRKSIDLDTDEAEAGKKGVNFIIPDSPETGAVRLTLNLQNIPLLEAARQVANLANLELIVEAHALSMRPRTPSGTTKTPDAAPTQSAAPLTPAAVDEAIFGKDPATQALERKLKSIIIPKLEFRGASIGEALEFLQRKALELDPDKRGVKIVLAAGVDSSARITLNLTNIPLLEALKYITGLGNLAFKIQGDAIVVKAQGSGGAAVPGGAALPAAKDSFGDVPIEVTAEETRMDAGIMTAAGDAKLTHEDLTIKADKLSYDPAKRSVHAEGHAVVTQAGNFASGEDLTFDLVTRALKTVGPTKTTIRDSSGGTVMPPANNTAPRAGIQTASRVAGKTGFVFSPYAPTAGYIDVRGFPPGVEIKCPYSGRTFFVP